MPIACWGPLKTQNFEKNMEEKLRIFKGFRKDIFEIR